MVNLFNFKSKLIKCDKFFRVIVLNEVEYDSQREGAPGKICEGKPTNITTTLPISPKVFVRDRCNAV